MKRILRILTAWLCAISLCVMLVPVYADEDGGDGVERCGGIWTGFASCESGSEGARQAGGDNGHAYGLFQFDDRYDLIPFLGECLSTDEGAYGAFQATYTKYNGSSSIVSSSAEDTAALVQAWHNVYDADPEGFTQTQLDRFVEIYYTPCVSYCSSKGIDIEDGETYSPVIRGTLMSICIWAGSGGVQKVINRLSSSMTELEMLDVCYSDFTAELKGSDSSYISSFRTRWTETQKTLASQAYTKWLSGGEIPTTESDSILSMLGGSGMLYTIDGGSYIDYIKAWLDKYGGTDYTAAFRSSGWNTANKEWCMAIRNAGNFYEMYGITGNGVLLDLVSGTTGGTAIDGYVNVNAENYEVPDNGGSNPVVYFSQGGGQPWSSVAFGGGNIASSGCSITSLAMVISYLLGGTDRDNWVYPSDVRATIAAHNGGNYNAFYVDGAGQSHDIIPAVAGYYGLTCNQISSESIIASLSAGNPVIMRCGAGEFTQNGHFIVLTGLTDDGYVVVNDPSHPEKSYLKYTVQFLRTGGGGTKWWSISK